ncbi:MAG TPA: hypothetical protein VED63_03110 [Acidimicrobiales bacterium]|nr:hypothetical protein [Acidimicrobiales bacterium]
MTVVPELATGQQVTVVPVLATGQQVTLVPELATGQQVTVVVPPAATGQHGIVVPEAAGQQVTVVLATGHWRTARSACGVFFVDRRPEVAAYSSECVAEYPEDVLGPTAPDTLGAASARRRAVAAPAIPARPSLTLMAFIDWPPFGRSG